MHTLPDLRPQSDLRPLLEQRPLPEREGQAICPYCGVGCLLDIKTRGNEVVELKGTPDSPVNQGLLCPKGALLAPIRDLPGRLLHPQVDGQRATWDDALAQVADRLQRIIDQFGAESVALYGSGQLDSESWYVGNKLMKGYIGSNHVDSNSRLCMASSAIAYTQMLGSDGPPTCYEDIEHADCMLIVGSNMADTHPVTFQRVKRQKPRARLIVVDPRLTNTAKAADLYVPIQPGGDIPFFNALGRILLDSGAADQAFIDAHTDCFDEYAAMLQTCDVHELANQAGVPLALIEKVAEALIGARAWLSFYCMGLGQSREGVAKHHALIDLHLMLGQIGKVGAGPFSLTGQPNAMGGRELGGLAHLLPGYRQVEDPAHRREVEQVWRVPAGSIAPTRGLTATEMFCALEQGQLKAIWIVGTNPLVSLPNLARARQALRCAELVIVQDCFETETSLEADIVLPAAQWIERDSTMTNSERRVTRSPKLIDPPAEAMPDWWIFSSVAQQMGFAGFDFAGSPAIWDEFRKLTAGRPCDVSGMTNARLEVAPLQWPCPDEDHPGTARRYIDGRFPTPDGLARFVPAQHRPPSDSQSAEFPLVLTTGRIASQWHTMTRTGKIAKLANQARTPYIEIHPADAEGLAIAQQDKVCVTTQQGSVIVEARIVDSIVSGSVFMPFHWGDLFAPDQAANYLTSDVVDPVSMQPEFKWYRVRIQRAEPIRE